MPLRACRRNVVVLGHSWPVPDAPRKPRVGEQMLDNRRHRARIRCEPTVTTNAHRDPARDADLGRDLGIALTTVERGDLRIRLTGELDLWSAPALSRAVDELRPAAGGPTGRGRRVVIDLHELTFLDTAGLTALEKGRGTLAAAGWLVTVGRAQPHVRRLLRFAERSGWLSDAAPAYS